MFLKKISTAIAVAASVAFSGGAAQSAETLIIATGSTGGTSYFVGSAIAQVVNKHSDTVRIEVLPTGRHDRNVGLYSARQGPVRLAHTISGDRGLQRQRAV